MNRPEEIGEEELKSWQTIVGRTVAALSVACALAAVLARGCNNSQEKETEPRRNNAREVQLDGKYLQIIDQLADWKLLETIATEGVRPDQSLVRDGIVVFYSPVQWTVEMYRHFINPEKVKAPPQNSFQVVRWIPKGNDGSGMWQILTALNGPGPQASIRARNAFVVDSHEKLLAAFSYGRTEASSQLRHIPQMTTCANCHQQGSIQLHSIEPSVNMLSLTENQQRENATQLAEFNRLLSEQRGYDFHSSSTSVYYTRFNPPQCVSCHKEGLVRGEAELFALILAGRGYMPPQGGRADIEKLLSDDDVREITVQPWLESGHSLEEFIKLLDGTWDKKHSKNTR